MVAAKEFDSCLIGSQGATATKSNQTNFGNSSNNNILSAMRLNFIRHACTDDWLLG
jgi:hypothetical protein